MHHFLQPFAVKYQGFHQNAPKITDMMNIVIKYFSAAAKGITF